MNRPNNLEDLAEFSTSPKSQACSKEERAGRFKLRMARFEGRLGRITDPRSTKIFEQSMLGRFTQPQCSQPVESHAMPPGAVSVPRSEAGRGTARCGQPVLLGIRVTASALGMRVMALWII